MYIGTDREDRSVVGITKNINERISSYKTHNPDFEIKYVIPCKDYVLTEKIVKVIMRKYTVNNSTEWFDCSCDHLKIKKKFFFY